MFFMGRGVEGRDPLASSLRWWTGLVDAGAELLFPLGPEVVGGVEREADPDEDEPQQAFARARLVVNPNAEYELHGGCEILEQTHGREPDALSAEREEQQRDRGDHPRAQYEDVGRGIDAAERTGARVVLPQKKRDGERGEEEGFNGETDEGAERRFLRRKP